MLSAYMNKLNSMCNYFALGFASHQELTIVKGVVFIWLIFYVQLVLVYV